MKEFPEYPRMVYGPKGEQLVVQFAGEIPEGYKKHPSEHEAKPAKKTARKETAQKKDDPAEHQRFRVEAIAFLKQAGVELSDDATDEEIDAALSDVEKGKA